MFALVRRFHALRVSLLQLELGPNGYPISPIHDCVDEVPPEEWLSAYTDTIDQADAMNANGVTANIPEWADSTPAGNNAIRMCKKGY
ncbi:hypothetical protein GUITHDRAFT_154460 [Guillardia theta CCMP2712]|uniref:Uncharacterized protein n=1 Tax=Guillardia theta (strain CCMP2712) TaxID=905079 RepID=L1ITD4_GUITC|nr:hypothetical protein GUITHDRAFT_154460 [Guillardia theta CCMP2712]EKX39347.1 hypothetical protein GUITHDRAFT_154460 [Guillardia theta CCMP2712]|eukprot:XP_005826327.1 hypothetical protein GUITHDRAFT_154460 [Guillardia theta CCMP2712]